MIEINALPNICTGGNLLFGVLAIAAVFNHNYVLATVLIILAAILDRLDGYLARRYNSSSDFGRELDSLADLVSFGVAPSVMLYAALAEKWRPPRPGWFRLLCLMWSPFAWPGTTYPAVLIISGVYPSLQAVLPWQY